MASLCRSPIGAILCSARPLFLLFLLTARCHPERVGERILGLDPGVLVSRLNRNTAVPVPSFRTRRTLTWERGTAAAARRVQEGSARA